MSKVYSRDLIYAVDYYNSLLNSIGSSAQIRVKYAYGNAYVEEYHSSGSVSHLISGTKNECYIYIRGLTQGVNFSVEDKYKK